MREANYLSYLPDLFSVGAARFCVKTSTNDFATCTAEDVSQLTGPIVTLESNVLVDQLRQQGFAPPDGLIDIGDALKLIAGRSKADGGAKAWDIWRELRRASPREREDLFSKELFFAKELPPPADIVDQILRSGCLALEAVWQKSCLLLEERGEVDRFVEVEIPSQQIFNERQFQGIRLNTDRVKECLLLAKAEKYHAYLKVASFLNLSPTGLTFRNVGQYLEKTDAAHLSEFAGSSNIEEHFKIAAERSEFAKHFVDYIRASRDVNTLNRMSESAERVHPFFHTMGTVTGRILVSEPYIQQLRRRYRTVIAPDNGNTLVYLDYRQFEPGIMAHLSGDAAFIEAYNSSDLYSSLSTAVFGNTLFRSLCKKVFLAYCYGMTREGLVVLLAGASQDPAEKLEIRQSLDRFFDTYPGLATLKAALEASLAADGNISTLWGNKRYRTMEGQLSPAEKRWSLSQRVQGTAALIFKEALVTLSNAFGPRALLLPMHDAILLQFPDANVADCKERATSVMAEAFARRCPSIVPKISDEPFAAE